MKKIHLLALVPLCLMAACSTLPSPDRMANMPVVEWGQPKPSVPYILHIPAGKPVTADAMVDGNLFSKTDRKTLTVTLAKDIYLYYIYASRDVKHWSKAQDLVTGNFNVRLPSTQDSRPGRIAITLSEKPQQ